VRMSSRSRDGEVRKGNRVRDVEEKIVDLEI